MHLNAYYVSYAQRSNQHVSAATAAIFRVMLLQEHKVINVVSCTAVTTEHNNTTTPSTHHLHPASKLTSLYQASLHTGRGKGHPRKGHVSPEE